MDDHTKGIIKRSGAVHDTRPLVAFLYLLMRNEVVAGTVEGLVREAVDGHDAEFCNGWLASYAKDVADRLLAPTPVVEDKPAKRSKARKRKVLEGRYVIRKTDVLYHCSFQVQDGTETFTRPIGHALPSVIYDLVKSVYSLNRVRIRKQDIMFVGFGADYPI